MGIKNTKLWRLLRRRKNAYLFKKHYRAAKKMPKKQYESYLTQRYKEMMNRHQYSAGKELNLAHPVTFTEKCQWIKLYDQDPRKPIFSDKYAVRQFIKDTIGEEYLVPLISIDGVDHFTNANQIDFSKLPNSFVLKCNHGSHMNLIVKNKSELSNKDIRKIKAQLNKWLSIDYVFYVALETQYAGIKPYIIIEQFLDDIDSMREFKFTYFNNKLAFFWISEREVGVSRRTTTFLPDNSLAKFNFDLDTDKHVTNATLPKDFNKMREMADLLSKTFTMVRVDFYYSNNKILFSELTFNSAAGFDAPRPIQYDEILGNMLEIDENKRKNNYEYRTNEESN